MLIDKLKQLFKPAIKQHDCLIIDQIQTKKGVSIEQALSDDDYLLLQCRVVVNGIITHREFFNNEGVIVDTSRSLIEQAYALEGFRVTNAVQTFIDTASAYHKLERKLVLPYTISI